MTRKWAGPAPPQPEATWGNVGFAPQVTIPQDGAAGIAGITGAIPEGSGTEDTG